MNEMFWLILILGILNFVILIANFVLIRKFEDFKDISDAWNKTVTGHSKVYHLILEQYTDMVERYDSQKALFGTMCEQYEVLTDQYKKIGEITDGYRKLCKECVDRYGDAYDQFKLCTEKLDRIFIAPACSCGSGESVDNEPIGGSADA